MQNVSIVQKPEAGQRLSITAAKDTNLEMNFSPADAIVVREGDSLIFTFADGSSVEIADFYVVVTKESLPDFIVEGRIITGVDFFASLTEDLMPAAGPAATAFNGNRFREYAVDDLTGGVDSLGGLEQLDGAGTQTGADFASGFTGLAGLGTQAGAELGADTSTPAAPPEPVDPTLGSLSFSPPAGYGANNVLSAGDMAAKPTTTITVELGNATIGDILNLTINGVPQGPYELTAADIAAGKVLFPNVEVPADGKIQADATVTGPSGQPSEEVTGEESWRIMDGTAQNWTEGDADTTTYQKVMIGQNFAPGDIVELSPAGMGTLTVDADGKLWFTPNPDHINTLSIYETLSLNGVSITINGNACDNINLDNLKYTSTNANADDLTIDNFTGNSTSNATNNTTGREYELRAGSLELGVEDDKLHIESMSGGKVHGDATDMGVSGIGGNDSIEVTNLNVGNVYGDASTMSGSAKGGNDTITVTNMSGGRVHGDAGDMIGEAIGGDDNITVTNMSGNSSVFGDANTMNGLAKGGNDTITVTDMALASVYGDAAFMRGSAIGGDDTITVTNMTGGSTVNGDAYSMNGLAKGGNDTIKVDTMNGGLVYGDAYTMSGSAKGGDDIITITNTNMSVGNVYGDANDMSGSAIGGNDTIEVTTMNSGDVSGDAYSMTDSAKGGDDSIEVTNMGGGNVYGDVDTMTGSAKAGDDNITVTNMTGGRVHGDARTMTGSAKCGDDTITIGTMNGGEVYGDAWDMKDSARGGDDLIHIGTMNGGEVYGEGNHVNNKGGNDVIIVDSFGTGAVTVDGGVGGNDMFIYNNTANQNITLNANGSVSIAGQGNKDIRNFEGIGGGSGNDTLTGNSSNNFLRGGQGDDLLTGGGGNDVFIWARTDFGGSDTITDFNAGDKLYLGGLQLTDPSVTHGLVNGKYVITITDQATGQTQTITLDNTTTAPDILSDAEFEAAGGNQNMLTGTAPEAAAASSYSLLGGLVDDAAVSTGTAGDDTLHGTSASDMLFGGGGDDFLFGEGGDDFLDGGSGNNGLYGGTDNDIIVYSEHNTVMDGADLYVADNYTDSDADYIVGLSDTLLNGLDADSTLNLDDLLNNHADIKNVEVLVFNGKADGSQGIGSMIDLTNMQIADDFGALNLTAGGNDKWTATSQTVTLNDQEYSVFNYNPGTSEEAMQIAVQKAIIETV